MKRDPISAELRRRAAPIRLAIFDVDGVLTDGRLILGDDGSEYKCFHVRDGLGLVMLLEAGLEVAIISGRESPVTAERMRALGIRHVYQGCNDKGATFAELLRVTGLSAGQVAFTGDDLIDLPALERAGLAIAVADAHPAVLARADWVTKAAGGRGAAREVCELLLEAQDRLAGIIAGYQGQPN